jgi:hypothetical protein
MKNLVEKRRYPGRYWIHEFLELGSVMPMHRYNASYLVADGNPYCCVEHTYLNAYTQDYNECTHINIHIHMCVCVYLGAHAAPPLPTHTHTHTRTHTHTH